MQTTDQPRPHRPHLLTPRAWELEALQRAAAALGTPEGAQALVEAKRYSALADEIERTTAAVPMAMPTATPDLEPNVIAEYSRKDGHREWTSVGTWLRPGEAVAIITVSTPQP